MFCPECAVEYRDGFTRCSDCDVDLVLQLPARGQADVKLAKVFATSDPALIGVAESLLDDAGIDFLTKGAEIQDLIGGGRIGGYNLAIGPVEFWVREDEQAEARALFDDFAELSTDGEPLAEAAPDDDPSR
jgi:Putative prokaryotic signal transducing protein